MLVVGIGASAGGLEALQAVLSPLPSDCDAAIVVAQHVSPDHQSLMASILAKAIQMPVVQATDGMQVQRGLVIVCPPNRDVTLHEDRLRLVEPPIRSSPSPSVDLLFDSIAETCGDRGVAVVLSGTGADGARGMRAVRGAGGLTIVQDPATAGFDGMPRAAIALGAAALVTGAAEIAERLQELASGASGSSEAAHQVNEKDDLTRVLERLQRDAGIDFSRYKATSLRRQIARRMAVVQCSDLTAYVAFMAEHSDEAHALAGNLLVTVTSFFRDSLAFAALRNQMERYIAANADEEVLRIWVPGCATGEEVYSIAMLTGQLLGFPPDLGQRLKVFGTDLDETSLTIARRASYAAAVASSIPEQLLRAYTRETPDGIQMLDVLRECTVFARHNVTSDPPFPRMDVISCRNTMIYFDDALQAQVLDSFAFALRPGGILLLGGAEAISQGAKSFRPLDLEQRVFERTGRQEGRPLAPSVGALNRPVWKRSMARLVENTNAGETATHVAILEALIRLDARPLLVLDEAQELVQVVGDVSPYCQIPEGRISTMAGTFLRPEFRDEMAALLLLSRVDAQPTLGQRISLPGLEQPVRLLVSPIRVGEASFTAVSFVRESQPDPAMSATAQRSPEFDRELLRLQRELVASQDTLRRSLTELQTANEELEASSEELQASSEELQAANEELQAANEELQASNEELGTVNQELRVRGELLSVLNADLENIQGSLSQGMIIVDLDLLVRRFTPLAVRVFALVDADIGQPLLRVPTTVDIPGIAEALQQVVAGGSRISLGAGQAAPAYLVQVLPYHAKDRTLLGAIITLTDVSELVTTRNRAEVALAQLKVTSELLAHEAAFDASTGLMNRRYFSAAVNREVDRADRASGIFALAWIDVDRFKDLNDEFGHEAGDLALLTIAERVQATVRSADVVSRLGGDEFGVLISEFQSVSQLDAILERIISNVRKPIALSHRDVCISVSVGVAMFPNDGDSAQELLRAADTAMYSIKNQRGDAYAYFTPMMNQALHERRHMRDLVADAIRDNAFEMYYQPMIGIDDGKVVAAEALIRWRGDGLVRTASEFIPICEATGQIKELGRLALQLLRADVRALQDAGLAPLNLAFNVSDTQLADRETIDALLSDPHGLGGLIIEVVESVFLPEHGVALAHLGELAAAGAKIAIDDFGANYSNFRLLKHLAPDIIKLDQSFLAVASAPQNALPVLRSMAEMGHAFGARVVLEAVETAAQQDLAAAVGIDLLQGYRIARPMPMGHFITWLHSHTALDAGGSASVTGP